MRVQNRKQDIGQQFGYAMLEMVSQMQIMAARLARLERAMIVLHAKGLVNLDAAEIDQLQREHAEMERRHDLLKSGQVMPGVTLAKQ